MLDILEESIRLMQRHEPFIVATVVRTKGMTPQKAGAKQLFRRDGTSIGTLGGGCVEGDIWYYAKQMFTQKSQPELREYELNADLAAQDGLVCGGTMSFYIEPVWQPEHLLPAVLKAVEASKTGVSLAVATVVQSTREDLPLGFRILIQENGEIAGQVKDGAVREKLTKTGKRLAPCAGNELIEIDDVTFYVEGFTTPPTLIILGGGHVGFAVYQLALMVGFRVIVIDDRRDFANPERFPQAIQTIAAPFEIALAELEVNYNSFVLVATRGHRYDDIATRAAIATPARYIGLLGSKRKNLLIFKELYKSGIPLSRLKEIHAPVGLDIGAVTPEELAVSIMGEMIQYLRGGKGGAMKMPGNRIEELIESETVHE